MSELNFSDFKMFGEDLRDLFDPKAFTELIMAGIKGEEKIYGPVFTTQIIKYALDFSAQKIEEKPPEDIKTLDQLKEYLFSKADKYPPYLIVTYAQIKTENLFQGRTGAGTRIEMMNLSRNGLQKTGYKVVGNLDIDSILSRINQLSVQMKIVTCSGYKKNEDGSLDILVPNCHILEACKLAASEGLLKRMDGRARCGVIGEFLGQSLKIATGNDWDYNVLEAHKPHCLVKVYMI
ncbi:MAG: hypothetical protein QW279_07040 [Candidatus Jordarchaeaceae archaeon]